MTLNDLLEEFNVVIDTAEGLSELRSLILGLAVRGKLVPQDPNDEPASELLKKFEAEKKRLYDVGEIRKPKKLPIVTKEEIPFEIPESWKWVRFGEIFDIYTGNSISKRVKEEKYTGVVGTTYLGTKDVNYGFEKISYSTEVSIPEADLGQFNIAPMGSILVCAEGGSAGKKCGHVDKDVCFGNKLICNVPYFDFETHLLLGFIITDAFRDQFTERMTGIIGGISQSKYNELLFPLPPIKEQSRIVFKFNSLLSEVRQLESDLKQQTKLDAKLQLAVNAEVQQAPDAETSKAAWNIITNSFDTFYRTPESIDNLKKNILNEAVRGRLVPQDPNDEPASELLKKIKAEKQRLYEAGEIRKPKALPPVTRDEIPFAIPESWEWVRLGEVIELISGQHIQSANYNESGIGIPYLTGPTDFGEVYPEIAKWTDCPKVSATVGDILLTVKGSGVGKINLVDIEIVCISRQLMAIRPIILSNQFIYNLIRSRKQKIHELSVGIAIPGISREDVTDLLFALPPLEEQHRIVQRIEELFAICDAYKAQMEQREQVNERLVKGLVQEVLEGV